MFAGREGGRFASCSYEDSVIGPVFYWISRVVKWSDLTSLEREREKGERDKQLPAVNKEIQKGYLGFLFFFSSPFSKPRLREGK